MAYIRPNLKGKVHAEMVRAMKDVWDRLDVLDRFKAETNSAGYVTSQQMNQAVGPESTRSALKASGSTPLNIQALQGVPAQLSNLPSYLNNAAALAAGLTVGQFYRNGDAVYVVHS